MKKISTSEYLSLILLSSLHFQPSPTLTLHHNLIDQPSVEEITPGSLSLHFIYDRSPFFGHPGPCPFPLASVVRHGVLLALHLTLVAAGTNSIFRPSFTLRPAGPRTACIFSSRRKVRPFFDRRCLTSFDLIRSMAKVDIFRPS